MPTSILVDRTKFRPVRIAPVPSNEDLRIQDLHAHQLLDDEFTQDFTDLVALAARIYGCPMASIMLIDRDRAILKGNYNLEPNELSRDVTFCNHAILDKKVMLVPDATKDERFADNPFVTGEMNIRFYAGMPITSSNGHNLGAVCVMDQKPRKLTAEQTKDLETISKQISRLFELKLRNKQLLEASQKRIAFEKDVTQSILEEHHRDRRELARELHENIAQRLAATSFFMEAIAANNSGDPMIERSQKQIRDLMDEVRQLSYTVMPTTLESLSFKDTIDVIASQYEKQHQVKVRVSYSGKTDVDKNLCQSLYIVLNEAFDNARIHGRAEELRLHIEVKDGITIRVQDDGEGVNLTYFKKGRGLSRVASLVSFHNGYVDIKPGKKRGCTLQLTVPERTQSAL